VSDERSNRVRAAIDAVTVEDIAPERLERIRAGQPPTSLEFALIAEASGRTVDWLLHGEERDYTAVECHASRYVSLADTYDGAALCGCPNCREYVAERESEDDV
jgi:hypothetical protein